MEIVIDDLYENVKRIILRCLTDRKMEGSIQKERKCLGSGNSEKDLWAKKLF